MHDTSRPSPEETRYRTAGVVAITAAVLQLPLLALSLLLGPALPKLAPLILVYVPMTLAQLALSIYALYSFRGLLNERYRFHETDALIILIIVGAVVINLVGLPAKVLSVLGMLPPPGIVASLAMLITIGLALSVISIVFAVRLLRLDDPLYGLLKPFAYTTIAAAACFASIVLLPLAMLVDAASTAILGVIFLRAASGPGEVEFV